MIRRIFIWIGVTLGVVAAWFFATQPADVSYTARLYGLYLSLPNFVFEAQLEDPPIVVEGNTLHPKLQYTFQSGRKVDWTPYLEAWKSAEGRAQVRKSVDMGWTFRALQSDAMASVEDRNIPGPAGDLHIRIYKPDTGETGPLPVMLYMHGGAFIMGSVDSVDRFVRVIANEADVIVVSLDYRLAPEAPFPAANEDAIAAFDWVVANAAALGGDPKRLTMGGDSAGAYLSVATAYHRLEQGQPLPAAMLLYYPPGDFAMDYPSNALFDVGFGLDKWLVDLAVRDLFPSGQPVSDPRYSLVKLPRLGEMPPSVVALAGFDPIRDQGRLLASRMSEGGAKVTLFEYKTLTHNYLEYSGTIDDAGDAALESARAFRALVWPAAN